MVTVASLSSSLAKLSQGTMGRADWQKAEAIASRGNRPTPKFLNNWEELFTAWSSFISVYPSKKGQYGALANIFFKGACFRIRRQERMFQNYLIPP
jgi:hypothetical protein